MENHKPETLDDVLTCVQAAAHLPLRKRRELASALRTFGRWLKLPLSQLEANPDMLRRHFARITPATGGVGRKRFCNVRANLVAALRLAGQIEPADGDCEVTPAWSDALASFTSPYDRARLSRFVRFCSARGIAPDEVDENVSRAFLKHLVDHTLVQHPVKLHRDVCVKWNRRPHGGGRILIVPCRRNTYVLPPSAFLPSLQLDIEAFLARQCSDDPFDLDAPPQPLRKSTIKGYRHLLWQLASAVVRAGYNPRAIASLADLIEVEKYEAGLRYVLERRPGCRPKRHAGNMAMLLAKVARYWVEWPDNDEGSRTKEEAANRINMLARRLHGPGKGLSERARRRLVPFRDESNLARLFLLPRALAKDVDSRAVEGREAALIMQQAVATSILTYCPMRMETLASLRLDMNLRWTGPGMRGELIVDVEPGIVKNRLALSFPLPDDCASLVRGYIQTWRDKLLFPSSPYLFPSRDPLRHKQTSGFAVQLSRLIFERLGFRITPHDYRHLVHLVVLKRFPGAYAMVSRILGHKRLESTLRNYAHEDTAIALQLYHELIGDELAHRDIGTSGDPAVRAYALNEGRR